VNDNLSEKYFVGLAVDQKAPDHSSLTVFRERLQQIGKLTVFEAMLSEIVQAAVESGIQFGSIPIVDSVHSIANVNTAKDQVRQKHGEDPHDPDARWGVKHKRKVKTEHGKEEEQTEYFFGYKAHVSMNAENGLITSLETSSGEAYDGYYFCPLVDQDLAQQLPVETYAGDKGYDDGDNQYYLELNGLHSALSLRYACQSLRLILRTGFHSRPGWGIGRGDRFRMGSGVAQAGYESNQHRVVGTDRAGDHPEHLRAGSADGLHRVDHG